MEHSPHKWSTLIQDQWWILQLLFVREWVEAKHWQWWRSVLSCWQWQGSDPLIPCTSAQVAAPLTYGVWVSSWYWLQLNLSVDKEMYVCWPGVGLLEGLIMAKERGIARQVGWWQWMKIACIAWVPILFNSIPDISDQMCGCYHKCVVRLWHNQFNKRAVPLTHDPSTNIQVVHHHNLWTAMAMAIQNSHLKLWTQVTVPAISLSIHYLMGGELYG